MFCWVISREHARRVLQRNVESKEKDRHVVHHLMAAIGMQITATHASQLDQVRKS